MGSHRIPEKYEEIDLAIGDPPTADLLVASQGSALEH